MEVHDLRIKGGRDGGSTQRVVTLAKATVEACERHRLWLISVFSVLYFAVVGLIASRKQLENDEIFTLNITRLPGLAEVWSALLTGAEQLPPLFYILTRASIAVFGESNLALRLPAMLGFWVMSLCLFWFVSKRSSALYGLASALFVLTTGAYYYAFEARPYGLVLGFSGLALVSWQSLAEGKRRALPLAGLTLSLAAAVSCHYYAVLVLIPLACGEVARALARRRVDFTVWAAMVVSLAPLLIYLPLIKSARSYSKAFWAQPGWADIPGFYHFMLMSAALPVTAILILAALYPIFFPGDRGETNDTPPFGLMRHEGAAALGFLALPVVSVTMAMFMTRASTYRYALPAMLGVGLLMPFAFHRLLRGREILTILLVLCLAVGLVRRGGMTLQESAKMAQGRAGTVRMIQAERESDLPVVCSDPHTFLILSHYAPPEIRARLVYLADTEASRRYLGHDSVERGMFDMLKSVFHLNVQGYRGYVDSGQPFLLCGSPEHFLNWVLTGLVTDGAHIELRGRNQDILLFLVNSDGGTPNAGLGGAANGRRAG